MNNKQNIYLDKVIEFLVRDTNIDYKNEKITTPLYPSPSSFYSFPLFTFSLFLLFSSYSKEVYGLTDEEIEYVWKEYKSIITDKIKNEQ
jgi:hypothetical protein